MGRFLLGIDNGGSVSKAAIYDVDGTMVSVASTPVSSEAVKAGWSERNMDLLWKSNLDAMRQIVQVSGVDPADILGITCTGHGNGVYLVDGQGDPVRNGIVSNDSRAAKLVERWSEGDRYNALYLDSTMQQIFTGAPIALLAHLAENEPESMRRTHSILMIKDYIRFKLTGRLGLEITDASCTNLLDMRTRRLTTENFKELGVGDWEGKLPDLVGSNEVVGGVLKEVADYTGLKEGTPVFGGISDISASAIGCGAVEDYQPAIITGTWSINEFFAPEPVVDPDLFMTSLAPFDDRYLIMEASPTSAASLDWLVNRVLKRTPGFAQAESQDVYEWCNDIVFSGDVEPRDVGFMPYLYGSNLHPNALGGWFSLSNADGLEQLLYSLYEGVAFSHREHVQRLRGYADLLSPARITGGVTNSAPWTQMFADVLALPLETVNAPQSGILGAVIVAAVGAGVYPSVREAASTMVTGGEEIRPDGQREGLFQKRYAAWKETVDRF